MQSTHYLFDFGLKPASKHRWEMAPWFSRALSNAGSCSRLCTQAIVYCTRSSASQRNPEKNKTFTSLPTQSNGPNPLFFFQKKKKSALYKRTHMTVKAELQRQRPSELQRQDCSLAEQHAKLQWKCDSSAVNVSASSRCVYRHCFGPTFLILRRAVTYFHLRTWTCGSSSWSKLSPA